MRLTPFVQNVAIEVFMSISLAGDVGINSSPSDIRNCNLYGLVDLNGRSEHVRKTVAGYLNRLIEIGVAGIRIDAAKYMWPGV